MERKLEALLEAAPTAIIVTRRRGQIVLANARAEAMFGYSRDELLGQMIEILLPERLRRSHVAHREAYLRTPRVRPMGMGLDLVGLCKGGTEFPIEVGLSIVEAGDEILVTSFISDITGRRRADEELRKLSRAVEQSPSTVVITDLAGNIEYVNPRFTEVTGYTEEEALGQNPRILKSGEQSGQVYAELWETISSGGQWRGEFSNRKKDGSIYWEFASVSPIRNVEGEITHFLKVAEDITQRKTVERALREHMAELEARNEELDAFAHTVAHDLRNPLGLVMGLAEVLEEEYASLPETELRKHLTTIARTSQKMGNIVEELLLLAGIRKTDVELEPLDMAEILAEVNKRLAHMTEEYQAELVLPGAWPKAFGYAPWVEEIWVNYLSNALKYGGRPPRVELGATKQADGMVRFWVRDNGPGLSQAEQSRLFVPFTKLAQVRVEGFGLGLSIVRRIVDKLGGQVGVESEGMPGRGSTFSFTLPSGPG